jgi:hypothetical protein
MRRILIYSLLLIAGMGLSQLAFVDAFRDRISTLTLIFLAYIMLEVGMEFDIDKSRLRAYAVDYASRHRSSCRNHKLYKIRGGFLLSPSVLRRASEKGGGGARPKKTPTPL